MSLRRPKALYIGCADLYRDHPDYAGEVDHAALIERLESEYDGWVLHAAATPQSMAVLAPLVEKTGARWMSWVKGFAAFKRNVSVAYAWEPEDKGVAEMLKDGVRHARTTLEASERGGE